MQSPRKYNLYRTDFAETFIGTHDSYDAASEAAQRYADEHGEDVYMAWNGDDGGTRSQRVATNATADHLETWAMNHHPTYEEYFAPLARTTEKRYRKDPDGLPTWEHARKGAQNLAEVAAIRFDHERAKFGGHRYYFRVDVIRETADSIAEYIIGELEAGNSWLDS